MANWFRFFRPDRPSRRFFRSRPLRPLLRVPLPYLFLPLSSSSSSINKSSTASPSSTSGTPASPSETTTSACSRTRSSLATPREIRARPLVLPPLLKHPKTPCCPLKPFFLLESLLRTRIPLEGRFSTRETSVATRTRDTSMSSICATSPCGSRSRCAVLPSTTEGCPASKSWGSSWEPLRSW